MAAEAITPVDEIGMPLPLAPIEKSRFQLNKPETDNHHAFHPGKSPILTRSLGGKAMRAARLQVTDWHQHHIEYHGYYHGPPLPDSSEQQYRIVVFATAGYVPDRAISFNNGEPEVVPLPKKQRQQMWDRGDFRTDSPDLVRNFLIDHIIHQNLLEVNERLVDEFLHTPNMHRRQRAGGALLNLAIEKSIDPINQFYRQAWERDLIHRASASGIHRLVKNKIQSGNHNHRKITLVDRLEQTLAV